MKKILAFPWLFALVVAPVPASAVSTVRPAGNGGVVLRASVPTGGVVNTGDRVAFEYQTRADAAVLVFSIDSRGYVHLLYPQGQPELSRADTPYSFPAGGRELVVDTPDGVEFAFAVAVTDPSAIDTAEMDHLRGTDVPGAEPYRITGDPFIAANMIAAELVRGISHREVYFGYTTFNVNRRVEYPCYLCGACDGVADSGECTDYRVVQNFDRAQPLTYPLRRGYNMIEPGVYADGDTAVQEAGGSEVTVNFYPYGSTVRYADPYPLAYPYDWGWWNPYAGYWPAYYPYCYDGWSVGIGFGWGWGWGGWSGYYCSGWYAPPCYGDGYYYPGYPSGGRGGYPGKFKSRYKSGDFDSASLTASRMRAARQDGDLRIAQRDVQRSVNKASRSAISPRAKYSGPATIMKGRNRATGNTRVIGSYRGRTGFQANYKTGSRPASGVRVRAPGARGGTGGHFKGVAPTRGHGSSGAVRSAPRSRGMSNAPRGATPRASSAKGHGARHYSPPAAHHGSHRASAAHQRSSGSSRGSRTR